MKRRISAMLLAAALLLCGCDGAARNALYDDDEKIAAAEDSYSAVASYGTAVDGGYALTATMSGMRTIWRYDAQWEGEAEVAFSLSTTEGGRAKLVHIGPDGVVTVLAENEKPAVQDETTTVLLAMGEGRHRIKVVAQDKAKVGVTLKVGVGELGVD